MLTNFPLEKILSTSPQVDENKFNQIGIHCSGITAFLSFYREMHHLTIVNELIKQIPKKTELVIGYRENFSVISNDKEDSIYYSAHGVALIPK